MTARTIVYTRLSDVEPAERNPKGHDIAAIKASIVRLGFLDPVIHDGRTGKLIAGHGRLEALIELYNEEGATAPEGIELASEDVELAEWLLPVTHGWVSNDDAEVEAAIITLNSLVPRGGWDDQMLGSMLLDVQAADTSLLELTGYTPADITVKLDGSSTPDFAPVDGSGGGLDEPKVHECPACEARWVIDAQGAPQVLTVDA